MPSRCTRGWFEKGYIDKQLHEVNHTPSCIRWGFLKNFKENRHQETYPNTGLNHFFTCFDFIIVFFTSNLLWYFKIFWLEPIFNFKSIFLSHKNRTLDHFDFEMIFFLVRRNQSWVLELKLNGHWKVLEAFKWPIN